MVVPAWAAWTEGARCLSRATLGLVSGREAGWRVGSLGLHQRPAGDTFMPGTVFGFEVASLPPHPRPQPTFADCERERKHNLCACAVTARGSDALVAGPGVSVSGN